MGNSIDRELRRNQWEMSFIMGIEGNRPFESKRVSEYARASLCSRKNLIVIILQIDIHRHDEINVRTG